MAIKAVIFDIYGTLLEVLPPPALREMRWNHLWMKFSLPIPVRPLEEFERCCREEVTASHARSRDQRIECPEVDWRKIAQAALPELASWQRPILDDFLYEHAQLAKTIQLMSGTGNALRNLMERQMTLGICSNCQNYTLRELTEALCPERLSLEIFDPECCFWSFQAGFSKPNPEAFHRLQYRLGRRGIQPEQILMVGDRADNDILPAQSMGWQTWQLSPNSDEEAQRGGFDQLLRHLNFTQ